MEEGLAGPAAAAAPFGDDVEMPLANSAHFARNGAIMDMILAHSAAAVAPCGDASRSQTVSRYLAQ